MAGSGGARAYRLSPPDRTGWMFGLNLVQLLICSSGVVLGIVLMQSGVGSLPSLAVMFTLIGVGAARLEGMTVVEGVPHAGRYLRAVRQPERPWFEVVPVLGGSQADERAAVFADHELIVVDGGSVGLRPGQVAVSRDRATNCYSATLRVSGRQFALVEPAAQDELIAQWGIALQAFINERTPVSSVRWSEWAAPAGLDDHHRWLNEQRTRDALPEVEEHYLALLREAGSQVTRHETLVTVTIDANLIRLRRRDGTTRMHAAVRLLLGEMRLFAQRLEGAQLVVHGPLGPQEWARAMRLRLDPSSRTSLDSRARALGDQAGGCRPENAAPMAAVGRWTSWQADDAWHRAFSVSEWPRLDVGAGWLAPLIGFDGAVRNFTVFFEPIAPSDSRRSIRRQASKLSADSQHRTTHGFRVGADYRRAATDVEDREAELVAGYGEVSYAGIVVVTAQSEDELDEAAEAMVMTASRVGIELRPLSGRHDQAVCATLPMARPLVPRTMV
jgi:hypothetical protein